MPSSSYLCSLMSAMTYTERIQISSFVCLLFTTTAVHTLLETTQNYQRVPEGPWDNFGEAIVVSLKVMSVTSDGGGACTINSFLMFIICQHFSHLSDDLADILNHHLICCYGLHCKQAPLVDVALSKTNPLLSKLISEDKRSFITQRVMSGSTCCKYWHNN